MKRKNVWVASDGTEFPSQEATLEYERSEGFRKSTVEFVAKHMKVSQEQAEELTATMGDFWILIRDNSEDFQKVLNMAKPRKLRGRPPSKQLQTT